MTSGNDSSTAGTLATMADQADETMHQRRRSVSTRTGLTRLPSRVDGRVFRRLQQFAALPSELKAQVDAVAVYLSSPAMQKRVFQPHARRWLHVQHKNRVVGPTTRGATLISSIYDYLLLSHADDASHPTAQQLASLLVLSGFISPVKEPRTSRSPRPPLILQEFVQPREYYELVSSAVTAASSTSSSKTKLSVWDVVDGATRAGVVFRKQPTSGLRWLLSMCLTTPRPGREKKRYVVVNREKHHAVFVFSEDVSRQELHRVELKHAKVSYDAGTRRAPSYHGLKLWTNEDDDPEYFDFLKKADQDEWLLALLDGGAKYRESHAAFQRIIASPFHNLHDLDEHGKSFRLGDAFANKVVLLVNVASKDPEAALQYPQLVALANKYEDDGLVVVACPTTQFLGLELSSHAEIVAHVKHTYGVGFRVLPTRDVNGPQAREPFVYCNAHLPGVFGPFTEWNFTKFLIDRSGTPFLRYETRVLPLEMEPDIRMLLGARYRRLKTPIGA